MYTIQDAHKILAQESSTPGCCRFFVRRISWIQQQEQQQQQQQQQPQQQQQQQWQRQQKHSTFWQSPLAPSVVCLCCLTGSYTIRCSEAAKKKQKRCIVTPGPLIWRSKKGFLLQNFDIMTGSEWPPNKSEMNQSSHGLNLSKFEIREALFPYLAPEGKGFMS